MQVTQTVDEGLKREFRVVLEASDLDRRAISRIEELKDRVRINGFRPGKVPLAHLKRLYGRSVMVEVIEQAVAEANSQIVADNSLKLALEPKVTFPENQDAVQAAVEGQADLTYTVALEVLPEIVLADFTAIAVEKPVAPVEDADVDQAIDRLIDQNRPYETRPEGSAAEPRNRVTISFKGTIGGEPFDGGTAEDVPVVLGSDTFIPGFEPQLIGIKVGETRTVNVTFPANYLAPHLAGKDAAFEVTCTEIAAPGVVEVDDAFAKTLGIDTLDGLKDAIRNRLSGERDGLSRARVKRALLDALDERHSFALPDGLVAQEFDSIWGQITSEMQQAGKTFADEDTTEEAARAEYRKIAERRVRLGLVLAELGTKAEIKVTDDEVTRQLVERARSFPGQEQQVWDYYRKNPNALASLRAPIFEEKVVDHLLTLVQVTEKRVSKEELFREEDADKLAG
ncbi:trigger factor [Blastochloris viridis]|uniref:Trigger factor n=1 Tax=Blastochloris viridis TaxID=1079 RepID=A0A0H5BC71_BLAVI|nr:trigger factor [Blastochloris viridis]ALK08830.1 Trigger factor [Blastochloris viridis]BAR97871.1 cell division trigger factor [Blastochloris viridis]CUU41491.1 Trigger factor [Blastochloris viridis]